LEPIHKKYKANRSMRTHVMKEHNNKGTTNTCKDNTGLSCGPQVDLSINSQPVFVVKIVIEN
jgi:hypothetical protein